MSLKILENNRIKKRIVNKEIDGTISFGEKFKKFLEEYKIISKTKLKKIEKELDQHYHTDVEYAINVWKSKMSMRETLRLMIIELVSDTKEASKTHLKMRRMSKRREYEEIEKERTYPKKMTSTKRIISKFYKRDKDGNEILDKNKNKILDIDKIIDGFQSYLGRQGVMEISSEHLHGLAIIHMLRKFLNDNTGMTPEKMKLKKKVEEVFSKLLSSIS